MGDVERMKFVIDAEVDPGFDGGIDTYLLGLLHGLGRIREEGEEYVALTTPSGAAYFREAGEGFALHAVPNEPPRARDDWKTLLGSARRPLGRMYRRVFGFTGPTQDFQPVSKGFWESLGAAVVHQTYPLHWKRTDLPSVLTMHDLQHRHFPGYFDAEHLRWRENIYPQALDHSQVIVTISEFVKRDIVQQYGIPSSKILVAHNAPWRLNSGAEAKADEQSRAAVRHRYGLPAQFLIYPAMLVGNKNHATLLEAVALLRDRHRVRVQLLCPGRKKAVWPSLERLQSRLRLEDQVRFLDFVPRADLETMFEMATAMFFASVFEGAGIPVVEAFQHELPVFCSDIPALREYAGDAAHFFDPHSPEDMALALRRAWEDAGYRADLQVRGSARAARFNWASSAQVYRQAYRSALVGPTPANAVGSSERMAHQ